MTNLVILESPSKAHTVKGFLGNGYKVVASKGHIRDLPLKTMGIDIDKNFTPHYINISGKKDIIEDLRKEASKAKNIYLATDPDREGEAISWHLATALKLDESNIKRVTFNEITKDAVINGINNPRSIDMNLVDSQQTRRILDRLVGYSVSPILWKTIGSRLSAGRVQSVATRLIVDRENEINSFKPEEYWTLEVVLKTEDGSEYTAKLYGTKDNKLDLKSKEETDEILSKLDKNNYIVTSVKKSTRKKNALPPFTTSTLQQEASKKLGFQVKRIMKIAQELYEGINLGSELGGVTGLITYMRTDSLRISKEAQDAAREYIKAQFGKEYCPDTPKTYKVKKNAQDAHEAIRPANIDFTPDLIKDKLSDEQYKLYKLIWSRFVASQMESAEYDTIVAEIYNSGYVFRTSGSSLKFPGFLAVYKDLDTDSEDDDMGNMKIGQLKEKEKLSEKELKPEQHFTEPPARYTEASLVKTLEEMGIGRPSTTATIISAIIDKNYVSREGKALKPTDLGFQTNDFLMKDFPDIVNYQFTASLEDDLDNIENGTATMLDVLNKFYDGFKDELKKSNESVAEYKEQHKAEETDIICDKCGAKMIIKNGRHGRFAACPNYPKCKNTMSVTADNKPIATQEPAEPIESDKVCSKCGSPMVIKSGPFGNFYACSAYPKCKNTMQIPKEIGVPCPKCGSQIIMKYGKERTVFYSCEKYPECDFSSWDKPIKEKCPECGKFMVIKKNKNIVACSDSECGYQRPIESKDE